MKNKTEWHPIQIQLIWSGRHKRLILLVSFNIHTIYQPTGYALIFAFFCNMLSYAAMAGMDRFPQKECADTIIPPPPQPTAPSQEKGGAFNGMAVYNPVDENFEGWPSGRQEQNAANTDTFDEDDIHVLPNDSTLENNNIDNGFDINDPEVIASQEKQLSQYETYNKNNDAKGGVDTSINDDALAQAIAEQDLPPGVTAAEQQEIMMRLLTQQLRRGDWGTTDDENGENGNTTELSPALEQRLRDFQFAQKKRREKYGNERPWGILGLYDHLGKLFGSICLVLSFICNNICTHLQHLFSFACNSGHTT